MHSRRSSLISILAGAIFASLGNPASAARRDYNPGRPTTSQAGSISTRLSISPPSRGKATTSAPRSKELTNQLIEKAAAKRARKNEKRHYDYQTATRFYVNHENFHMPLRPFAAAQ